MFTGIDYFFLIIGVACIAVCTIKGFIDSIFNKAAPVVAVIASVLLYRSFTGLMSQFIKNQILCTVATFLIIFIVVFILMKILQKILGSIFEDKILDSLNHVLGFGFGLVEALALIALILFLLSAQPLFDASKLLDGSFFYKIFRYILGERFVPAWEKGKESVAAAIQLVNLGGKIV